MAPKPVEAKGCPIEGITEGEEHYAALYEVPTRIRATCYTSDEGAITASGRKVKEGYIAGRKEWCDQGYVVILYNENMQYIGQFEFMDTGAGLDTDRDGKGDSIRNGTSIDIYRNSLDRCYEWVNNYGDYVYMQIIKGKG